MEYQVYTWDSGRDCWQPVIGARTYAEARRIAVSIRDTDGVAARIGGNESIQRIFPTGA